MGTYGQEVREIVGKAVRGWDAGPEVTAWLGLAAEHRSHLYESHHVHQVTPRVLGLLDRLGATALDVILLDTYARWATPRRVGEQSSEHARRRAAADLVLGAWAAKQGLVRMGAGEAQQPARSVFEGVARQILGVLSLCGEHDIAQRLVASVWPDLDRPSAETGADPVTLAHTAFHKEGLTYEAPESQLRYQPQSRSRVAGRAPFPRPVRRRRSDRVIEAKGAGVRQEWSPEELLANWTLVDGDWDLVANKSGTTRLGFSLLLKFFELEGRFPDVLEEVPPAAVEYVADLVKVPATDFAKYTLVGRTAEYHRKQIREALGFRPSTVADEKALAEWLAVEVCPVELVEDRQREALLVECRARKIEPPGRTRVEKVLVAARGKWEKTFCARTVGRLGEAGTARLLSLVAEDNEAGTALLAALKRDPGAVGLDSLLTEITKLNDVRKLGLPDGLFTDCSEKLVAAWRARAIKMYPSDFRDTAEDVRITLLAALCSSRQAEITDALVALLVALVHKINARAERRVEKQLTAELKKVRGKEGILFKLATAAVDKPDEVVRRALFPVVGEKTLRELVAEAKANEKAFKAKVRTTLRSSYSSYYRQMLPPLLNTLGFRGNNTAYRPVMDAMKLLKKYADVDGKTRFYDAGDDVPMDGVVRKDWREAVVDDKGKVERIPYELCVLVALRDAVRRREIYVEGAARWRNPEDDLPGDFEATRAVHYAAIRQPLNPRAFIADLKKRMTAGLDQLSGALADGSAGGVEGHHPQGRAVDHRAQAGAAGRAHRPGGPQGGGRAPLGRPGPPGRAEERRLPHRFHRGVLLGGRLRAHRA
ncbi:DUF4158 domain-containing protein [Streptomyces sp. NPDC086782]|uniref:DUF4158 domain-containing protein n=2 Tax=Streptomyces TaxID=1883 RepID=UPI00380046CF